MNELEILKAIVAYIRGATLNELMGSSGLTRTRVNEALESLEAGGLVEPKRGEWRLTTKGHEVVKALKKLDRATVSKILRTLPNGEGFYFYRDVGQYTGRMANSLSELHRILEEIEDVSITFHIDNRDVERWLVHIGDEELVGRMKEIASSDLPRKALRSAVLEAVERRLETLTFLQSILG